MSIYFISDLHLDADQSCLIDALSQLVEKMIAEQAASLYILGDFFEAWIGDDVQAAWLSKTIQILNKLADAHCQIYFMHGNRDFLVSQRVCDLFQGTLITDPLMIELFDEPTLLLHGDSLCIDDQTYQAFRRQVRSPGWRKEFLEKPLKERETIAQHLRSESKQQSQQKPLSIMDVSTEEVERVLETQGVRRMIHGHTHRPHLHKLPFHNTGNSYERWVLGDWFLDELNRPCISYLEVTTTQMKLVAGKKNWVSKKKDQ